MPKKLHEGGPPLAGVPPQAGPQGNGMGSSGAADMSQATDSRPVPVKGSVKGKKYRGGGK